jgi:glycine cleavage system H protein
MAYVPEEYYYTKDHEWAQVDENVVTVGITEYAQQQLGEVVYVDLPEEGQKVTQDESFGAVESVKAASDLIAPVSGTVIEVNNFAHGRHQVDQRRSDERRLAHPY